MPRVAAHSRPRSRRVARSPCWQDLPESMRGTGLGIASTAARTALILVPTLARAVRLEVSSVLCAALALVAGSALVLTAP